MWHAGCGKVGNSVNAWRNNGMARKLVDAFHTNTDSARWPYLDRLIDLHDAGLVSPEVWRLICDLTSEYEAELAAFRERHFS
jgi:hypothetical protein